MLSLATRILIVDDMLTMRKLIIKLCKEIGFTDITEATDGAKAWEAVCNANPPFRLIISDWNMPNLTGIEMLKRLRADQKFRKTWFLMVTAESELSQIQEARAAGVDDYILKPFDKATLTQKLVNLKERA